MLHKMTSHVGTSEAPAGIIGELGKLFVGNLALSVMVTRIVHIDTVFQVF